MPELPEVETIRSQLDQRLKGKTISEVDIIEPVVIKFPRASEFSVKIRGRKVKSVERRSKYLLINLTGSMFLLVHLKMTGQLLIKEQRTAPDKHTHLIFRFESGEYLYYRDIRKFGSIKLLHEKDKRGLKEFSKLGVEPLGRRHDTNELREQVKKRKTGIKALLLGQQVVAGLGNIYVDEVLHEAGISPARPASGLKKAELKKIIDAMVRVLEESITAGGTSMRDFVDTYGRPGRFQERLKVYSKTDKACPRCGAKIVRTVVAQRGTYFCPKCQK